MKYGKVYDAFTGKYGHEILSTIMSLEAYEKAETVIETLEGMYESGTEVDIFTGAPMTLDDFAVEAYRSLESIAKRAWVSTLSREIAIGFYESLTLPGYTAVTICEGITLSRYEIASIWKETHDGQSIYG